MSLGADVSLFPIDVTEGEGRAMGTDGETKELVMSWGEDDDDEIQPAPKKTDNMKRAAQVALQATFSPLFGELSPDKEESPGQNGSLSNSESESDGEIEEFQELEKLHWLKTSGVGLKRKRSSGKDESAEKEKELEKLFGGGGGNQKFENTGLSEDVDMDLQRLVPERETGRIVHHAGEVEPLFAENFAAEYDGFSREDVASLLDQNTKTADVTAELDTPLEMNVTLLKHQRLALAWMVKREMRDESTPKNHPRGGILADDQGLGKTLSALALILHSKPPPNTQGGTLIVCPVTMLNQWRDEINDRIVDGLRPKVLLYYGPYRTTSLVDLKSADIVVTTYSTIQREFPKKLATEDRKVKLQRRKGLLYKMKWFRIVLDEAQVIKNRSTDAWSAAFELEAERRWCLTGTPIQNTIDDIYSLFIFLRYLIVDSYAEWRRRWKQPMEAHNKKLRERKFKQFQVVLGVVLLRRVKSEKIDGKPVVELPPRDVQTRELDFSREERAFYRSLERRTVMEMNLYILEEADFSSRYMQFLTLLLRLRQTCGHPSLCDWNSSKVLYTDEEMDRVQANMAQGNCVLEQLPPDVKVRLLRELLLETAIVQECPVCLQEIDIGQGVVTKCGHLFCCVCEERWFCDNDHCAICRYQLKVNERYSLETARKEAFAIRRKQLAEKGLLKVKEEPKILGKQEAGVTKQEIGGTICVKPEAQLEGACVGKVQDNANPSEPPLPNNPLANLSIVVDTQRKNSEENFVSSTKIDALVAELRAIRDAGKDKALVFSQWTRMLDLIEIPLDEEGIQFERLDGSMNIETRNERITEFKRRSDITCMLVSLHAGGVGLNLSAANHVFFVDLWWNPAVEEQAIDRVHRIGQTKPVRVVRFTIRNTVEDRIIELQNRKRELMLGALGVEGMQTFGRKRLTLRDIGEIFGSVIQNTMETADDELHEAVRNVANMMRRLR